MLMAIFLWTITAALVGHFGRHRSLGFWGVFLFSLIFSPVIGVLALLVFHTPEERRTSRTVVKRAAIAGVVPSVAADLQPIGAEIVTGVSMVESLAPPWLLITWCSIVLVFAVIYTVLAIFYPPGHNIPWGVTLLSGFVQSLSVGSLGAVTTPGDRVTVLLAAIERLGVLLLLVAFMAHLAQELRKQLANDWRIAPRSMSQQPPLVQTPLPKTVVSGSQNGG